MRALIVLALFLALPADAEAGKKKKRAETPAPVAAPASDGGTVGIGVPARPVAIELPCPFTVGTTRSWRRVETNGGEAPRSSESRMVLTVVESTDRAVVVDVGSELISLDSTDPVVTSLTRQLDALGFVPRVRYDHVDMTLTVVNLDEALVAYARGAEMVLDALPDAPPQVGDMVRGMLSQPTLVEQMTTTELLPLFQDTCRTVPIESQQFPTTRGTSAPEGSTAEPCGSVAPVPLEFEAGRPNPLGGPPLLARGVITVARKNPTTLVTRVEERFDPAAGKAMLEGVMAHMGDLPPETRAEIAAVSLDVARTMSVEVAIDSGWVTGYRTEKRINAPGRPERVDTLSFTIEDP